MDWMDGKENGCEDGLPVSMREQDERQREDQIAGHHVQQEVAQEIPLRVVASEDGAVDQVGEVSDYQWLFPRVVVQNDVLNVFEGKCVECLASRYNDPTIIVAKKWMVQHIDVGDGGEDEDQKRY